MHLNKKHFLIMIACCVLPILGLALIAIFNIPTNFVLWGAMLLICPLSHVLMMKFMDQEHSTHQPVNNAAVKDTAYAHHETD